MNADESEVVDNSFYFNFWSAEVEQHADAHVRCLQVIEALRGVHIVKTFHCLNLDENFVIHHEIGYVLTYDNILIMNVNWPLLIDVESLLSQLLSQSVFVNFL